MDTSSINIRYSALAEESCCLSCGSAINYAGFQPGECCVDLGSGRGTDALRMAESVGQKGFVFGVDVSDGMLETARKNAEKLGLTNISFIKSDLEKIAIPGGIADLVISNCTINHAMDKLKVWNEIYRILKVGGRFVVSDIYAHSPVPEEYRNDPVAVSECWAGAITLEEYLNTIKEAGFTKISILEEGKPSLKGKAEVCSFTILGRKEKKNCCC
jgi:SAM-dependent methyltransferase